MPCEVASRFVVLYGSQRGQAQAIAEEIGEQAAQRGLEADLSCLSEKEKYDLEKETAPVVFVVSTTGDGEPPDTAVPFVRRIKKKTLRRERFARLCYALLALGDTNYANFCNCGKTIDKRLQELGGKRFYATGHADDAVGLELVVDSWIEGLWDAVRKALSEMAAAGPAVGSQQDNSAVILQETAEPSGLGLKLRHLNLSEPDAEASEQPILRSGKEKDVPGNAAVDASLTKSLPPLSESSLKVPALPPPYLSVCLGDEVVRENSVPPLKENQHEVQISRAVPLTRHDSVKAALLIELDVSDKDLPLQPGGVFDVLCPNNGSEVEELLQRLKLGQRRDHCVLLELLKDTRKKGAQLPAHIPEESTLQYVITWCLELRSVPKKALLRSLVECTTSGFEKRRLQELCSTQGSADYNRFIRDPNICLLDLLRAFPSCTPPLSLLIEHLPKLQSRSYSAASSKLRHPGRLHFVFNIVESPACPERPVARRGLCTGWLADLVAPVLQPYGGGPAPAESSGDAALPKIYISLRPPGTFHLPADPALPLIMVGPGTGVAPFIGFLQHREKEREQMPGATFGESWLFFGCRHKDRDFLFREDLEKFVVNGTLTHLKVCFSRDNSEGPGSSPKYVHHSLQLHSKEIISLLLEQNGCFYVCGDAKNMAKDVNEALIELFRTELQVDKLEAMKKIATLREEKRYLQDIWS
ncbi:methionine synthase reductase-like isoform X2 [Denticeps clupeoides]|nr:methionine synthase reductase-like isoform X2 [Denticeps clupeoides]